MFSNGNLWMQILLDAAILLTAALTALLWLATVGRAYRELRAANLPRLERLFWLALVIVLPVVGFAVYRLARQVEAALLPPAQAALSAGRAGGLPLELNAPGSTQPAGAAARIRWRFLAVAGPEQGRAYELDGFPALIGRGRGAHVRLDRDGAISRRHAEVYTAAGGLRVRDLGSRHGIAVNEVPAGDAPLRAGDRLQVGRTTLFLQVGRTD